MFELKDFTAKPCSSRTGYDFIPKRIMALDLFQIAQLLRSYGFTVDAETPLVILAYWNKSAVSVYKNGKILVKDIPHELEARAIAEQVVQALNQNKTSNISN